MLKNLINVVPKIFAWTIRTIKIKTNPVKYARAIGVTIGKNVRIIDMKAQTFGTEPYLVKIGNHVTVSGRVQFITHDGGVWVFREKEPGINVYGKITVGDNVFIGYGVIILPDVKIGNNVVVGAGATVCKDIPNNSVAVGVPAKVIKDTDTYYTSIETKKMITSGMTRSQIKKIITKK